MKHGRINHPIRLIVMIAVICLANFSAIAGYVPNNATAVDDIQCQLSDTTSQKEFFDGNTGGQPSFPGGDAALMRFISEHVVYPEEAYKNNIEGKVVVQFIIEETGKVGEVKVARSVSEELDREAVRVMKLLPDFNPAHNALGRPVKVWYTLPVTFKIQGEDTEEVEE